MSGVITQKTLKNQVSWNIKMCIQVENKVVNVDPITEFVGQD